MSNVYIVVATTNGEIEALEAFYAVQIALGRGFQLASNKSGPGRTDLFIAAPNEETLQDGTTRWVFMDTNKQSVAVFGCEIGDSLPSQKDPASFLGGLGKSMTSLLDVLLDEVALQLPLTPPYNFMDPSLPVGWKLDGQPALMSDLLDGALAVKDPLWDLSDAQKWALIEARVRKSPGYPNQTKSLHEISGKTDDGKKIRDQEINHLHALREDLIAGADHS